MSGKSKHGFTLIEIMVVIAILGVLLTVMGPLISKFMLPRRATQQWVSNVNALMRFAWQHALTHHKVHKVGANFEKNILSVEMATGEFKDGQPEFAPIKAAYLATSLVIPEHIKIKNFIIEGFDEKGRSTSGETKESWFYIMPDGLTQAVTINFIDTKQNNPAGKPKSYGLVLNPFNAQFRVYESFQK